MGRPGLTRHRKFKRLARALDEVQVGFGEVLARGALELLWDAAYEAGVDFVGDQDDVEALAHWRGEKGMLCAALLAAGGDDSAEEAGFIEPAPGRPGRYRVHDLYDHAPEYVRKRMDREAVRQQRGETLEEVRSRAARAAAEARWAAKDASRMPDDASRMPRGIQSMPGGTTPAPPPAPAPAPTPTPAPPPAPEADGREDESARLVAFRQSLSSLLGREVGRSRQREVTAYFEEQLQLLGPEALLEDCWEAARRSTSGVPGSLAWFVPWLKRLPPPAWGAGP